MARLRDMARRIAEHGPFDDDYDIPHTTLHTGLIGGGTALNIVPEACAFEFECRHLPGDAAAVTLVKQLVQRNATTRVAYGTEAGLFQRDGGIPAVVCGPGHIAQAHKPNEFVEREQIERVDAFMQRLLEHCRRDGAA